MHEFIERARKAAGISGMKKNYPDNPKERGCGYWAAFIGSLGNDLAKTDQERLQSTKDSTKELREKHNRIEDLEAELRRVKDLAALNGVEVVRQEEGWSIERGNQVLKKIAG